jgi:two-component sensor histidine kinase
MIVRLPTLSVRRALLVTTLVAIVPAIAIIIATGMEYGRTLEQNVRLEAARQVEAISTIQTQTVESVLRTTRTIASLPAFRDDDRHHVREVLQAVLDKNPEYENMAITDLDGIVTVSPGLSSGTDLSDRKHIRDCIAREQFVVGEFILARTDGRPSFPFAIPVRDRSERMIAVLTAVYRLTSFESFFERLDLPPETVLGVTDHNGVRIYFQPAKETNPIGVPIASDTWRAISSGADIGETVQTGSDGIRRLYSYQRLYLDRPERPYMYVVVGYPEPLIRASARRILHRNVILMIGVVAVAAFTGVVLGGAVIGHRLEELARTASAISHGDFSARSGIDGSATEIGQLAGAIDEMAERLEVRIMEREQEREQLSRSLREKEMLLREIHHRVKNNMQLILSIVSLQRSSDIDLDTFSSDLETRISAMAIVHEMLYESTDISVVHMQEFLERLASGASLSIVPPIFTIDAGDVSLRLEYAIPLSLIVSELITNSCKYGASPDGTVHVDVRVEQSDGFVSLSVRDAGPGFPEGFAIRSGTGLGMRLVTALTDQLRGTAEFATCSGDGAHGAATLIAIPIS